MVCATLENWGFIFLYQNARFIFFYRAIFLMGRLFFFRIEGKLIFTCPNDNRASCQEIWLNFLCVCDWLAFAFFLVKTGKILVF